MPSHRPGPAETQQINCQKILPVRSGDVLMICDRPDEAGDRSVPGHGKVT